MPEQKKIICKCCSSEIGSETNNTISIVFALMKEVGRVEFEADKNLFHIKCRCSSWNTFDNQNNQKLNYQKKAQEQLNFTKK